ncbi:phage virion morphogenesis protein [Pseudomonas sp.]|uniref:phage virion morphogenesis protein n=1 Tax=Pseudomonas sp. TaxID=306 RepID=UPI00258E3C12|nr:phage virion morphogenesis protein [Pseudomonas sp.]
MATDLQQLEDWAAPLLAKISPAEQRKLVRSIAVDLRRRQADRIKAQQNPDGSAFAPRKPQPARYRKPGQIRQMFGKLRLAKHLKVIKDNQGPAVGILGRSARIARVHQYGLTDQVQAGGPSVQYPERALLGFTDDDVERIRDLLLEHLAQ